MSPLETEIQQATVGRALYSHGYTAQQQYRQYAIALNQLPDVEWLKLSAQAKDWHNFAVRALIGNYPIPALPTVEQLTHHRTNERGKTEVAMLTLPDVFAATCKARFDALVEVGFDSQQAMDLVCASMRGL